MGSCCTKPSIVQPDGLTPTQGVSSPVVASQASPARSPNVLKLLRYSMAADSTTQDSSTSKLSAASDGSEQPDSISSETSVKVAVLVRPLLQAEYGELEVVQLLGQGRVSVKPADNKSGAYNFVYDAAYRMSSPQARSDMFKHLGLSVVERVCQGFNGAVLAYGQTGSGKTYNMGTAESMATALQPEATAVAILPGVVQALWGYINAVKQQYTITIKVTYIEIYNEQVQDLLRGFKPARPNAVIASVRPDAKPDIRENAAGEVVVDGVTQVLVNSPVELAAAADYAATYRVTASHKMNDQSSRSHAILMLTMEQRVMPQALHKLPTDLHYLRSHLHLVDLAGSERVKETQSQGLRFQEGISINKGLLELGNVISALAEGKDKRRHVPYRNSKLTRVLQDCLGGNAETLMLACVSPASSNLEQTLNTLRYAQRARAIRNQLCLNNKPQSLEEENAYLRALVAQLQAENMKLHNQLAASRREE